MAKFLDDTGLGHFWDKIKSKFYNKTETDTLLADKANKFCYPARSSFSHTFNCITGCVTSGQRDVYFFIPMPFCEKLPNVSTLKISVVFRHVNGGYAYAKIDNAYIQLGDSYVTLIDAYTESAFLSAVNVANLSYGGFTLRLTFKNQLYRTNTGTLITNNSPIAAMIQISGLISA